MRIENVTLAGFRCFGPKEITVPIAAEITAVVGPNAAGKTALLYALAKLFGVSRTERTVQRSDFHLGADDDPDDRDAKVLFIDVLIGLPDWPTAPRHRRRLHRGSGTCRSSGRQDAGLQNAAPSALGGRWHRRWRGVAGSILGRYAR